MVSNFLSIKKQVFYRAGGFDGKFKGSNAEDAELGYRLQKIGYKIPILRNLNSMHLVNFGFIGFFKKLGRIHTGEMKMFLRKRNINNKITQSNYLPVIISIIMLSLQLNALGLKLFYENFPIISISLSINSVILFFHFEFLKFIFISKGLKVALKSIPMIYLHTLIFIYCFIWGIIDFYLFRNKY